MSILIIHNPAAGNKNKARLQALVAALKQRKLTVDVYATKRAGDATEFLRAQTNPANIVVVVGGDGTVREVVNGLHASSKLAIFATGTANVMSYELKLPHNADEMADLIMQNYSVPVQFGRANGENFCMWVGLGFDAWVVDQVNLKLKHWTGKMAYVVSMLVQALRYGQHRYQVQLDGKEYQSYSAVITHARYYGGSFTLSNKAQLLVPQLYILLFQKPGRGFFLKALFAMLLGRMEQVEGVLSLPFSKLHASLIDSQLSPEKERIASVLQADGDVFSQLPIDIELDTQSVSVLVNPPEN